MRRALLFVAISHCVATHAGANPLTSADVPAGFEALVEGQVEQVEVTLLGRSMGLLPVLVRPDGVRFEHPDRLARALIDAGATADTAALTALLRDPLAGNGHLACQGNAPGNGACDYVPTESLAVIHDQSEARISVFLRKDWLPVSGAKASEWHTPSEAENALIHRQIVNVSGSDDYRAINVDGVGALGVADNGHVGFGWHYSNYSQREVRDSTFELDNVYYRHDLGRTHYVQAGRMDMRALSSAQGGNFAISLMPFQQLDGMRAGTTMAFLNRSVAGQGTPVTIVLNQRARVDAFRGEQILGTAYFDAGLHEMDTGNFPEGSYPVTLKVIENGEVVRTEVVPFTRTGGGASGDDRLQWFIQTGRTTPNGHQPDERPEAVVNAGVRLPVGRDVNLTSALTLRDGETYNESRVDWRGAAGSSAWSMSAAVLAGTDGTRGDL